MAGSPPEKGSPSAENRRADPRYVGKDLGTQCAHAGERWERLAFWPSSTPIHNATTFVYDRAEDLDDVVWRRKAGYSYSRAGSPTASALERVRLPEGSDGSDAQCRARGAGPHRRSVMTMSASVRRATAASSRRVSRSRNTRRAIT